MDADAMAPQQVQAPGKRKVNNVSGCGGSGRDSPQGKYVQAAKSSAGTND